MSKKKIFILLVIILVVSATALSIFNSFQNRNIQQEEISKEDLGTSQGLPISENKQPPLSDVEIKKQFETFVTNSRAKKTFEGFLHTEIIDPNKSSISLNTTMPALEFIMGQELSEKIIPDDYQFFSCYYPEKSIDFGIKLNTQTIDENDTQNSSPEYSISIDMKKWENTILKDLHNIIFPKIVFSPSELSQNLIFKDGLARYAEIKLPNDQKSSINYSIVGRNIFISTSIDCLKKGANELFRP